MQLIRKADHKCIKVTKKANGYVSLFYGTYKAVIGDQGWSPADYRSKDAAYNQVGFISGIKFRNMPCSGWNLDALMTCLY